MITFHDAERIASFAVLFVDIGTTAIAAIKIAPGIIIFVVTSGFLTLPQVNRLITIVTGSLGQIIKASLLINDIL